MRFAYINSQGKEVAIPSVEALQLRIELGAITSTTMFYDVSADKWAPAEDHDIFRTLQRELTDKQEGVFVAPPPPHLETPPPRDEETLEHSGLALGGMELIPTDVESVPPPLEPSAPPATNPFEGIGFELTPLQGFEASEPSARPAPQGPTSPTVASFDFGELAPLEPSGPEPFEGAPPAPSPDLDLEKPLGDQDFGSAPPGWAAEIEFEKPMSEYTPEGPSAWMDQVSGGYSGDAGSGTKSYRDTDAELEFGTSAREEAPAKPEPPLAPLTTVRVVSSSAPKARRSISGGLIATLFLVGLLAGGGWFGLSFLRGRVPAEPVEPTRTYEPVTIPALAAELEPTFRALAPLALQDAVEGLADLQAQARLPDKPNADWLSGRYLAGASGFADVADYWNALNGLLAQMRSSEEGLFRGALLARMDSMAVPAEARTSLEERAVAGFRSALPDRDAEYDRLAEVFRAATGLHVFLLANEDNIDYEPAAQGISRDPVLEAVPLTKQLGDEMWGRVDGITAALEAMGALGERDGVSTAGLFGVTLRRLAETPVP